MVREYCEFMYVFSNYSCENSKRGKESEGERTLQSNGINCAKMPHNSSSFECCASFAFILGTETPHTISFVIYGYLFCARDAKNKRRKMRIQPT